MPSKAVLQMNYINYKCPQRKSIKPLNKTDPDIQTNQDVAFGL